MSCHSSRLNAIGARARVGTGAPLNTCGAQRLASTASRAAALLYTSRSLDSTTGGNAVRQFALTDTGMTPANFGPTGTEDLGAALIPYVDNVLVTGLFNPNAISYTSPTIAGLTGSAMFGFGGKAGDFQAGRQYSGSLTYTNGGFMLNAALYDGNGGTSPTPVSSTVAFVGRTIGTAYTFGPVTGKASFTSYKVAGSFSNNVYSAGLDYRVTPALDLNTGAWYTIDRNDSHNHSLLAAIGADYSLSKRTGLYAQVGVVNNHGAMNTGLGITGGALFGLPGTTVGVNAGIHHVF